MITSCWIQLRLRVDTGGVGIAAYKNNSGIISRTEAAVLKSKEPMDVVLQVRDLRAANSVIIFNDSQLASQVEVLDATVLVTRQDWDQNKAVLASVR